jgi:hypothetical protein
MMAAVWSSADARMSELLKVAMLRQLGESQSDKLLNQRKLVVLRFLPVSMTGQLMVVGMNLV